MLLLIALTINLEVLAVRAIIAKFINSNNVLILINVISLKNAKINTRYMRCIQTAKLSLRN